MIQDRRPHLKCCDLTVEIPRHDPLTQQLEAAHLGFHQAAAMVAAPFLPDCSAQPAGGTQNLVPDMRPQSIFLPWLGVLPGGNHRCGLAHGNRFMAAFGVIGPISTHRSNPFRRSYLAQRLGQHRRIPHRVGGHFNRPDFQRLRIDPQVHLAPLAAVLRAMFFRFPLAFAQHLDTGTANQQVQPRLGRTTRNDNLQMLLPPADRTGVKCWPIQPG